MHQNFRNKSLGIVHGIGFIAQELEDLGQSEHQQAHTFAKTKQHRNGVSDAVFLA